MPYLRSDHFDGKRFFTPRAPRQRGLGSVLRWVVTRDHAKWTEERRNLTSLPLSSVEGDRLLVTFVNHSTVLIQTGGVNILTDPIWSERASPVQFAGPKRFSLPGVDLDRLPPIHVLLLSHNHYDHMDMSTLQQIQKAHAPRVYAALGNDGPLHSAGMARPRILDWWQSDRHSANLTMHCAPAQHFSGRSLADRDRALWCSWVLDTPGGRIYFAGDTGFGAHFEAIKVRFGDFRLAMLPIGAYAPRWFMSPVHMGPEEAVRAHEILAPAMSVAIHHECFSLADEPQFEPREQVEKLARERGLNFVVPRNGEVLTVPELAAGASRVPVLDTSDSSSQSPR